MQARPKAVAINAPRMDVLWRSLLAVSEAPVPNFAGINAKNHTFIKMGTVKCQYFIKLENEHFP